MNSPDPPAAPDPKVTGQAQAASNVATAVANQSVNAVDQYTPEGSVKYKQTGYQSLPDGFGGTIQAPTWETRQEYSPTQQAIYDTSNQTKQNIATIGRDQSQRIGSLLGTPVNISNEATEARLFDLGRKRLDPQFQRDEESLRTRLANSGIRQGSAAWDAEFGRFGESKNDAYNSLLLSGRGQAVQEAMAERNQPINEISALLSGSQVSQPNFVNSPQGQVAGVDYGEMVKNKYNADMAAYQQKSSNHNSMLGGLFGLATAPFQAMKFSDRRLKRGILPDGMIGKSQAYRYTIFGRNERGVMADEVAHIPGAVVTVAFGLKMVNYDIVAGA